VNSGFTVSSVNGDSLSPASQTTIKQSVANASHTSIDNVDLVSITRTNRRLLGYAIRRVLAQALFTYSVVANIHFNLVDFPDSFNGSYLAVMKSKQIIQAVESGVFQQTVRYYAVVNNASQLMNSSVPDVTILAVTVTPAPSDSSSSSSNDLTAGQTAGIVIGVTLGVIVLFGLIYMSVVESRKNKSNTNKSHLYSDALDVGQIRSPGDQQIITRNEGEVYVW
jgi:hypothetical protein